MARTPQWHREAQSTTSPASFGQLSLGAKGTGYTLDRIVFTIEFHTDIPVSQDLWDNGAAVFGIMMTQGNPAPAPPYPIDSPDSAWLWWERWYWEVETHPEDLTGYVRYKMRGGGTLRESNGARKITAAEGRLWLAWQAPSWPIFYAAIGISEAWLQP